MTVIAGKHAWITTDIIVAGDTFSTAWHWSRRHRTV